MITYNIQLAGYNHDQSDDKGRIDFKSFMQALHTFPWIEELEKANVFEDKSAPTLSAVHQIDERVLWVSIYGEPEEPTYMLGYVYTREKRGFFGLGSKKMVKCVDTYELRSLMEMEAYFILFFQGAYLDLEDKLKKL